MKRSSGINFNQEISRAKAIEKLENDEVRNIFTEDAKGKRVGGYKTIQEAEATADIVYLSLDKGRVYRLRT